MLDRARGPRRPARPDERDLAPGRRAAAAVAGRVVLDRDLALRVPPLSRPAGGAARDEAGRHPGGRVVVVDSTPDVRSAPTRSIGWSGSAIPRTYAPCRSTSTASLYATVGLPEPAVTSYRLEGEMEALIGRSFPHPGDDEKIREIFRERARRRRARHPAAVRGTDRSATASRSRSSSPNGNRDANRRPELLDPAALPLEGGAPSSWPRTPRAIRCRARC